VSRRLAALTRRELRLLGVDALEVRLREGDT
jgi:hypothetical protein